MGVRDDYGGGVLPQGFFDDLTRMNGPTVDRALEHFLVADEPMPFVEENGGENFAF
jgi:hypothetical protein